MLKEVLFIIGSVIGPGIFFLPFSLSPYGINAIISLAFSALFFFILGNYFSKYPSPLSIIEKRLGYSFAFFMGWSYWLISWLGSIIVINQISVYTCSVFPIVSKYKILFEISMLIILTILNLKSIQQRLTFELFFSTIKITPLIILPIIFWIYSKSIPTLNFSGTKIFQSILPSIWCFSGIEAMGLIVKDRKSFLIALSVITIIYITNLYSVFSFYGSSFVSPRAYAEIMQIVLGKYGSKILELMIIIQSISSLNSWILSSGLWAHELARKRLMPSYLCKKNSYGTPQRAILSGAIGLGILAILSQSAYASDIIIKFTNLVCNLLLFFYSSFTLACFLEERSILTLFIFLTSLIICIISQTLLSILAILITMSTGSIVFFTMKKNKTINKKRKS